MQGFHRSWLRSLVRPRAAAVGRRRRAVRVAVDADLARRKQHALAAHRSQLERLRPGWQTLAEVRDGAFLPHFSGPFELFWPWRSRAGDPVTGDSR